MPDLIYRDQRYFQDLMVPRDQVFEETKQILDNTISSQVFPDLLDFTFVVAICQISYFPGLPISFTFINNNLWGGTTFIV